MSDGIHGHGAILSFDATAVGNIISISGPNQSRDSIDISTMDSTAKFGEFIPGMLDSGEITVELNYDGTALGTANTLQTWKTNTAATVLITLYNGTATATLSCSGFITSLGHAIPFDDKVTQSLGIKLTGSPTYTDEA